MENYQEVIEGIVNKERNALALLYDHYCNHLYRIGKNVGFEPGEVEDSLTELYDAIWTTPEILLRKKKLSITMTQLYLDICAKRKRDAAVASV